jgi:chromosome partitioning protein
MATIAVASHKGGVSKTTLATNLAAALAADGRSVLLIDLDPQANATSALGVHRPDSGHYVGDVLLHRVPAKKAICESESGVHVIPSHKDLAEVEAKLERGFRREEHLLKEIETLGKAYDTIILDTPPALGVLTANALFAADRVMVPMPLDTFAYKGLADLWETTKDVRRTPVPIQLVISQHDPRTSVLNDAILGVLREERKEILTTFIPRCEAVRQAQGAQTTVLNFDNSASASVAFRALAKEVRRYV